METYYVNGYRIAARSYGQALKAASVLTRGEYPFDWPGERPLPGPTGQATQRIRAALSSLRESDRALLNQALLNWQETRGRNA